ncbi:hypothetical protein KAI87_03230 [Myxococcota bacterium]|nr:hypothetical protein [Myxococcota bacterium]
MSEQNRDLLKTDIQAIVAEFLGGNDSPEEEICELWGQDEQAQLADDVYQSLVKELHSSEPDPDLELFAESLDDFCKLREPVSSYGLLACVDVWRKSGDDKVDLVIHLAALAPSIREIREQLAIGGEPDPATYANVSIESFETLVRFISESAQPSKFARNLPLAIRLYAHLNSLEGEAPAIEGDEFLKWFLGYCSRNRVGLWAFAESDFLVQVDPSGFLNAEEFLKLSESSWRQLAELVHVANNAFVLRGLSPSPEAGLVHLVEAMAKKAGREALGDSDLPELIQLFSDHRYNEERGGHGYDLDAAIESL